ncbi:RabGAP/TBC [Aaosphaeria arxii CBS 175.79]|uniref:RabGAP/TBC n=1 Tax=Aaosphaeria arxii CBS 175.79 TaxID=1450172 RepID=A0A6A5XV47_9PLEO|nr:RabGAP/TBC [Aaosphaeria arxii CBS 175.79]KAF2016124.1 RabGAP/TBC [Aaosphaeria arxii CBS 175.79]
MAEPISRSATPGTVVDAEINAVYEPGAKRKTQYVPYRPTGSDYTPPASPQPSSTSNPNVPTVPKKGFRSKPPASLQMDTTVTPAYERPMYSPSPTSSPPPLAPLPSPHFSSRQRAPSLLRMTAVSSPLNEGFPRAEQPMGSPTFAPSMLRQGSGPIPTSDPRTIFNPLASNPVTEDTISSPQSRPRGMTSTSQQDFVPHPPLRSATSIPDYGQYRASGRSVPSSAYRPDRGGANWSHNDYYPPPRHFRGEEPRASFRSGWTNASSSFVDASGTERSSMATGRSSIASDNRISVASALIEQSVEHDDTRENSRSSLLPDDDDAVGDLIDAYCYDDDDDDDDALGDGYSGSPELDSSVVDTSDLEAPDLSRSYSHGGSSHLASEPIATPGSPERMDRPLSYVEDRGTVGATDRYTADGMRSIHNELMDLPQLPKNMSRISRQDWADFEAYSKKNGHSRDDSGEQSSKKRPDLAVHIPPPKSVDPLPQVDEDEAYPRRASTSVFDRKSTLFDFTKAINSPPAEVNKHPATPTLSAPSSPLPRVSSNRSAASFARDRYGFKKATEKISVETYDAWYSKYEQYVARRRGKWIALMEKQGLSTLNPEEFPARSEKVRRYIRKGVPPEWRGDMWWFYSGGPAKLASMPGLYASLVARLKAGELNKDDKEAIERDLDRTFPDNIHFRPDPTPENPEGKLRGEPEIMINLREVLQCFALNNPNIGYCQSLNFIAGLLLIFTKQEVERTFVLLTIITQTHLPGAHARSLANTEVNVLMMLIKEYLPKIWNSINDTDIINNGAGSHAHPDSKFQRQPTVALSCTSWFMSIFVGVLPIEVVLRVWDAFLYEGPRALFRYALAIFKLGEPDIRKFHAGDGELFMTVQNLPRTCLDPNILHDIAFVKKGFGSLSQNVIDQKRQFWTQQLARERSGRRAPMPVPQTRKGGFLGLQHTDSFDSQKTGGNGLRRKASRKFFRKDKS